MLSFGFDVNGLAPSPNENDDAGVEAEATVLVSDAVVAMTDGDSAGNEKLAADCGVDFALVERFSEKPVVAGFVLSSRVDENPDPNPENPDDEPKREPDGAAEPPNPLKTETAGAFDSFADSSGLVGFASVGLLTLNGLAVAPEPNEIPLERSPAPARRDAKFGVPAGALIVTLGASSFFSDNLNVNEVFSLVFGGLFSSDFFSTSFG